MTAGVRFWRTEGGRVRFTLGEAPAAVVAWLRRLREEVAVILAGRELAQPGGHDAAEGAALALHHAAPAGPGAWRPGAPDAPRGGLLGGAAARPPSRVDAGRAPPPSAWGLCRPGTDAPVSGRGRQQASHAVVGAAEPAVHQMNPGR